MSEHTHEELVEAWIRFAKAESSSEEYNNLFWAFETVLELERKNPEQTWRFIEEVWARDQSDKTIGYLSSETLENLLSFHGPKIIEKVEQKAKCDPKFAYMLGGVWQDQMTDEVWDRLQAVWDRRGWDGIPENDVAKQALIVSDGQKDSEALRLVKSLARWLRSWHFEVEITASLEIFKDTERLRKLDLIVPNWTRGELPKDCVPVLLEAVKSGVGCAAWYGGMDDAFISDHFCQIMAGGTVIAQSAGAKKYTVTPVEGNSLLQGINAFEINTERSCLQVDAANQVLATTVLDEFETPWIKGTIVPVAWTRHYGKGRVYYCSLGVRSGDAQDAFTLILRGLLWAAKAR